MTDQANKSAKPLVIQAPVTVHLVVAVTDGENTAEVTFAMPPGKYPTEQEMRDSVAAVPDLSQVPKGFRLVNKKEFWTNLCESSFGMRFAMPGSDEYDA